MVGEFLMLNILGLTLEPPCFKVLRRLPPSQAAVTVTWRFQVRHLTRDFESPGLQLEVSGPRWKSHHYY